MSQFRVWLLIYVYICINIYTFTGSPRTRALMGVLVFFLCVWVCVCVCLSWMREEGCVLTLATLKTIYDNLWYESNGMRSTWVLSKPRYIAIRTLPPKLWYFMIRIQQRQYYSAIQLQGYINGYTYSWTQPNHSYWSSRLIFMSLFGRLVLLHDMGMTGTMASGWIDRWKNNFSGLSIVHNL